MPNAGLCRMTLQNDRSLRISHAEFGIVRAFATVAIVSDFGELLHGRVSC